MENSTATMSPEVPELILTGAAEDRALANGESKANKDRDGWQSIIDRYLVEWGRNPECLLDDDLIPPRPEIIIRASMIALQMRDAGYAAPLRVVLDGEGGISFERRFGESFDSLNILDDGSVELLKFKDCALVSRQRLV